MNRRALVVLAISVISALALLAQSAFAGATPKESTMLPDASGMFGLEAVMSSEGASLDSVDGRVAGPPEALELIEGDFDQLATGDYSADPLGLIARADRTMEHSLGEDVFEVWICDVPEGDLEHDLAGAVSYLQQHMPPFFSWLADGRYNVRFVEGGIAKTTDTRNMVGRCDDEISELSSGTANGGVVLDDANYINGFGASGFPGDFYPDNWRTAWVSLGQIGHGVGILSHELGHTLAWPHSSSDDHDIGDDPMDVMGEHRNRQIGTLAVNRYASGWIDPNQVVVHDGETTSYQLGPVGSTGLQLLVVPTGTQGVFTAFGVRVQKSYDSDLQVEGIGVYSIDQRGSACPEPSGDVCWGTQRRTIPYLPNDSVDHVYQPGDVIEVGDLQVEIGARSGDLFSLAVRGCGGEYAGFFDIGCSTFKDDVAWLANEGITKGCNPPDNTRFCPDDLVTRGQMAAFLVRALGYADDGGGDLFVDDDGSTFEADIDKLGTAEVTKGCNPPTNDRFCPDDFVTRGQMAAFLVRALDYTDDGGGDLFIDDDGSIFENDIDKLATAGVTKGCNPPLNDEFCPTDFVTRGQMAAFLHRALGP